MRNADLAHLVERNLAKVEVAGSSPVIRSKNKSRSKTCFFVFVMDNVGREVVCKCEAGLEFAVAIVHLAALAETCFSDAGF